MASGGLVKPLRNSTIYLHSGIDSSPQFFKTDDHLQNGYSSTLLFRNAGFGGAGRGVGQVLI